MSTFECDAIVSPTDEGDAEIGDDGDDDDCGEEVHRGMADKWRIVTKFQSPGVRSKEEVEDHEDAGHLRFRSWCAHFIRGKGREEAQREKADRQEDYPKHVLTRRSSGAGVRRLRKKIQNLF